MPDLRFASASVFDAHRTRLSAWLRGSMDEVSSLQSQTLGLYNRKGKAIVAGWEIRPATSDVRLRVMLDDAFPFSHIKIAYVGECRHLQWPHVEENGFLCLPTSGWRPIDNLAWSLQERVELALQLLDDCRCDEFIKNESSKEFVSYWARSAPDGAKALSLLDLSNPEGRLVSVKRTSTHWLVGEDPQTIDSWLTSQGKDAQAGASNGVFACLGSPPALPFPKSPKQLFRYLHKQCPGIDAVLGQLPRFEEMFVILAVHGASGVSLIGARISPIRTSGFRKPSRNQRGTHLPGERVKAALECFGKLTHVQVGRADSEWIHGRGLDPHHRALASDRVVVLGCGSLGSQVAARLAQAGVGHLTLIDPEDLVPSNVGRHNLGMDSVMKNKAEQLAKKLSEKYPHASFRGIAASFQAAFNKEPEAFRTADLVISCVAETDQDLSWDCWRCMENLHAPTVYGWLGTQGTTGHALALTSDGPGLSCFFDTDGFLRDCDTDFEGDTLAKVEPGCGTEFQPYGPLAAGQVELLVTRVALDVLTRRVTPPFHRVYACSTDDLEELGGGWTERHARHRPNEYEGPFEYEPTVNYCGICHQCRAQ